MSARPFVSFVGAGPGDPELVTLKALRRLREAAVVVHDRLIPAALLAEAAPDAEIIDAGKAPGRRCIGQSEINWLLIDRARRRGRVVRLKGGDPSIFGRLAEEIEAVRGAGIQFDIVPGVTAATAAAAQTGISLTARGHTSMLILATGSDHQQTASRRWTGRCSRARRRRSSSTCRCRAWRPSPRRSRPWGATDGSARW